jgi:hypothetical protein
MKAAWSTTVGLVAILSLVVGVQAQDKGKDKEETIKGTITCAKCDLKVEGQKTCATVLKVTKDSKDTVYYFDKDAHSKYHKKVCMEPKKGQVTGTVSEKDGKKTIKVSKVEYDDK